MNNIKTKADVLAWAKMILDGKGEKYTPLGKADMFAIAKYVAYGYGNLTEDLEVKDDMPPPHSAEAEPPAEKPSPESEKSADVPAKEEPDKDDKPYDPAPVHTTTVPSGGETRKVTMTRGYALHHAQFTTQQAYDKFLAWSKEHPKEGTVMDFSTGVKSTNAAFAYWLMENIVVDVPANAR